VVGRARRFRASAARLAPPRMLWPLTGIPGRVFSNFLSYRPGKAATLPAPYDPALSIICARKPAIWPSTSASFARASERLPACVIDASAPARAMNAPTYQADDRTNARPAPIKRPSSPILSEIERQRRRLHARRRPSCSSSSWSCKAIKLSDIQHLAPYKLNMQLKLVGRVGVEPTRYYYRGILSPACRTGGARESPVRSEKQPGGDKVPRIVSLLPEAVIRLLQM